MRVLVTGGAGYIGSIVTEELLRTGHEVTVFDDLSKGHRDAVPKEAELVRGDLLDGALLRRVIAKKGVEAVVHMAAVSLVGESVNKPSAYYRVNVEGGLSLLDAMRDQGVKRFVFSSTAAVYGEPERQPIDEDAPTAPTSPYGDTKLAFEHALRWYDKAYDIHYVSLRYFNAAGASDRNGERHDPETHLIPLVLRVAMGHSREVTVFGDDYPTKDGTCIRDYIHVLDLAKAHLLALDLVSRPDAKSAVYNLGCGGDGYSVREVIEAARGVTGHAIPIAMGARRAGDPAVLVASSDRIRSELGFRPERQDLRLIIESAWRWLSRSATPNRHAEG